MMGFKINIYNKIRKETIDFSTIILDKKFEKEQTKND